VGFYFISRRSAAQGQQEQLTKRFKIYATVSMVMIVFLSHPSITRETLEIFACRSVAGKEYLQSDFSVKCHTQIHTLYIFIAIAMLLGYVIGLPAWGCYLIYNNRYSLENVAGFNFIYDGYKKEWILWEFVVFGRKAIEIIIIVTLRQYPTSQTFTGMLLLIVSLIAHQYCQPFRKPADNGMEFISISISYFCLLLGLLYTSKEISNTSKTTVTTVYIGVILIFLFYYVFKSLLSKFTENNVQRLKDAMNKKVTTVGRFTRRDTALGLRDTRSNGVGGEQGLEMQSMDNSSVSSNSGPTSPTSASGAGGSQFN